MKKYTTLLHRLSKIIDLEKYFYVITLDCYDIKLQGHKNDELFNFLTKKGFVLDPDEDEFDDFSRGDIKITLT